MRSFKTILPIGLIFLVIFLACSTFQPVPPTSTPAPPTSTSTPVPATPTTLPSPSAEPPPADFPSRIAYTVFASGEGIFIHTVDADGQNDVRLTGNDCLGALPAWSTDGSLIAYYCYDPDAQKGNLWVMNQDGSEARFVAELPDLLFVKWAPDNEHLVYFAPQPDGMENDIYVLDLTGGKITNITKDSPVWDAFPDWSPDGSLIAFTSDRAPEGKSLDDIWIMKPDGSDPVNLTDNGEDWEDSHPAWSPDGKTIAFFRTGSLFSENAEGGPGGLWAMKADGKNQRLVTAVEIFRAPDAPVWSPDGQYLAYSIGIQEEQDVWVVPAAGGKPVNVGDIPGEKSAISWSPDSKALIFTNDNHEADTLVIYLALADGSDTHPLLPEGRYGYGDWAP